MKKRKIWHIIICLLLVCILALHTVVPANAADLICDDVIAADQMWMGVTVPNDDVISSGTEEVADETIDYYCKKTLTNDGVINKPKYAVAGDMIVENNATSSCTLSDEEILNNNMDNELSYGTEAIRTFAGNPISISQSEYDQKVQSFINNDNWKDGASWNEDHKQTIGTKNSSGCVAYAQDFVRYMTNSAITMYSTGEPYKDINSIRAGDVIRITNHTFVVLGREGNKLWTAEGSHHHSFVRINKNGYQIEGTGLRRVNSDIDGAVSFEMGYHIVNIIDDPPDPEIEDDDYVIMSALRYDLHLNIEGDDTSDDDDNVNVERGFSEDSKYDVFKVRLLDNGYYKLIQNKTNHMAVSVAGRSSSEDANIQMYYWNPEDLSNTEFQWAIEWAKKQDGVPYHYIRPRCSGLYMTAAGSSNGRNVYQASKDEEDDDCQKWFFARYMKPDIETNSLPKGEVGKGYSAKLEADSDFDVKWTFNSKNDNLPPGLSLDKAGKITGTPTQPGTYTFSLDAENLLVDALGYSTKQYTIVVSGDITINKIALNKETLELTKGNSETLIATVEPANATNKQLMWTSDNTDVATVDGNGKVTAVSEGTAKITVSSADGSNKSASCMVIVKQVPKPTGIVIKAGEATGTAGSKVSVPVSIIGNTGLGGMMLTISTDTSLTLTDIKRGDIISDGTFNKDIKTGLVQWYTSDENAMGDGVLFTMEFEVKAGTQEGSYPVNIAVKDAIKEHVTDKEGGTLNVTFVGGNINILKVMAGDLIPDGTIAMNDVVKLARAVSGSVVLSENEKLAADVTGDGIVAMGDVVKLARFVAGAIKEL